MKVQNKHFIIRCIVNWNSLTKMNVCFFSQFYCLLINVTKLCALHLYVYVSFSVLRVTNANFDIRILTTKWITLSVINFLCISYHVCLHCCAFSVLKEMDIRQNNNSWTIFCLLSIASIFRDLTIKVNKKKRNWMHSVRYVNLGHSH